MEVKMKLIDDYLDAIKAIHTTGRALGEKLVEVLKPMFPDLTFRLGDVDTGIEVLFLWDDSDTYNRWSDNNALDSLDSVITRVFPELGFRISTPGIWLYPEEVDRVKQILTQWKESTEE